MGEEREKALNERANKVGDRFRKWRETRSGTESEITFGGLSFSYIQVTDVENRALNKPIFDNKWNSTHFNNGIWCHTEESGANIYVLDVRTSPKISSVMAVVNQYALRFDSDGNYIGIETEKLPYNLSNESLGEVDLSEDDVVEVFEAFMERVEPLLSQGCEFVEQDL